MTTAKKKRKYVRKAPLPSALPQQKSESQLKDEVHRHFLLNPLDYIQRWIIDRYNEATGEDILLTDQQKDGIEAVRQITTAKLKRWEKLPMTEEEVEISKKIGVSIVSGKGNGKDALAAMLIIWFMDCFLYPKVPCTSVSADQLHKVLWSELTKWLTHSDAKERFVIQNDKFYRCDLVGKEKDAIGKRWLAFPKTANPKASDTEKAETLAGLHENYQMIVVDEGSGIADAVFDPLEGTLTGPCNFIFMIFNPTRSKGYAIRTQYEDKKYWLAQRWNSEDSPLVSRDVIDRIAEKYGKNSNPYRIRVLGLPPKSESDTIIDWDDIEEAVFRDIEPLEDDPIVKSLDPGAGSDPSIIATRKGHKVYPFKDLTTPDSDKTVRWAGNDIDAEGPDVFRVDTIGIGLHMEADLRNKKGSIIEAADVRRKADEPTEFRNKRAEMFERLRLLFQRGLISIPNDEELKDELGALKWVDPEKKPLQVIEKKAIRKDLGRSPNKADALGMLWYDDDKYLSKTTNTDDDYEDNAYRNDPEGWMAN